MSSISCAGRVVELVWMKQSTVAEFMWLPHFNNVFWMSLVVLLRKLKGKKLNFVFVFNYKKTNLEDLLCFLSCYSFRSFEWNFHFNQNYFSKPPSVEILRTTACHISLTKQ